MISVHAPAKINLYLHVGPVREDGRHPLDSLVVFSDTSAGDIIFYERGGEPVSLTVRGVDDLSDSPEQNLIMKAVRRLEHETGRMISGRLILEKRLPVAAGIGGGSSDAAATLHVLNETLNLGFSKDQLMSLSVPLGGDVPACVAGEPVLMRGDGDEIVTLSQLPPKLFAVLLTPDTACPTGPVFNGFDAMSCPPIFVEKSPPDSSDMSDFVAALRTGFANDLFASAFQLVPEIGEALESLGRCDGLMHSAMSGSGATCFGLFETLDQARSAARYLSDVHPVWWCAATSLGKAEFDLGTGAA